MRVPGRHGGYTFERPGTLVNQTTGWREGYAMQQLLGEALDRIEQQLEALIEELGKLADDARADDD